MRQRWPLLLAALLALTACGEEAESAPGAAPAALPQPANPWDSVPPDSLYGATAVENLRVTPVVIDALGIPPGWDGMRIAAVSDLQLGLWEENGEVAAAAARSAAESGADLVVLLGDYLASGRDTVALRRALAPLRGRPVVAVLGDRDVRSDSLEALVKRTLAAEGIRVLDGTAVPFVRGGDTATVAGVSADLVGEPVADQEWVLSQLAAGTRRGILLTHNPIMAARAPDGAFPAVLAGGTFCGTAVVPGTPRLSWLNGQGLPGATVPGVERLYRLDTTVMFVTCGVGYSFVPVRFGAPPEVALVTLRRIAVEPAEQPADSVDLDTLIARYEQSDSAAPADTAQ